MAEDSLYDRRTLNEAIEGFQDFSRRFDQLASGRRTDVNNIVRFLRSIPADDMAKKRELAKYFQTADGQTYSREEKKRSYDDLLGTERNRRTLG